MKRICHITTVHPHLDVRIFFKECLTLASTYDVHLVCSNTQTQTYKNIHIHGINTSLKNRVLRATFTAYKLYKKALTLQANIYHFHDPEFLPFGLLLKLKGHTVIFDIHEDLPRQLMTKPYIPQWLKKPLAAIIEKIEVFFSKNMSALITATPTITSRFIPFNALTVTINNFPVLTPHENPETQEKKYQAVYVGSISRERGLIEMLEATKKAKIPFVFAGYLSIQNFDSILFAYPHATYLGVLSHEKIYSLLAESMIGLVILHPTKSYIESQPLKLYEYMYSKIPVITSKFPLLENIISTEQCGICVDPLNIDSITEAILTIIQNPEHAKTMGENGHKAILNTYNWKNEGEKLLSLYSKLA